MSRPIIAATLCLLAASCAMPAWAQAGQGQSPQGRVAQARIARIATAVATLEQVRVRLDWPAAAEGGELQVWAGRVEAPDLGYRYRDLHWRCALRRDANGGWRCEGAVRSGRNPVTRVQ